MDASSVSVADLALIGIDSQTILYVFAWGFGTLVFFWSLGFFVACGKSLIRKI
nr:hypothetical protein [uncultured Deefgea sp.]